MFCTSCGRELGNNASLCVHCGVLCGTAKKFCATCGKPVFENQAICLGCGCALPNVQGQQNAATAPAVDWLAASQAQAQAQQPQYQQPTPLAPPPSAVPGTFRKDWLSTLLIGIFLGWCGAHRFYVGKVGTGILFVVILLSCIPTYGITLIFLLVWWIIDVVNIGHKQFTDGKGNVIQ
ncbi:MAG: TM2 domain-containing protein [Oligosphaeraceae bacterium]